MNKLLIAGLLLSIGFRVGHAQSGASKADYEVYLAWLQQSGRRDSVLSVSPETVPFDMPWKKIWYVPSQIDTERAGRRPKSDTLHMWPSLLPTSDWAEIFQRYNQSPVYEALRLDQTKFMGLSARLEMHKQGTKTGIAHVKLSRITYSLDGQRAMFYYAYSYRGDAVGMIVFMKQEMGKWKLFFKRGLWMS